MQRYPDYKVQTCITPVDEFVFSLFDNVAHFGLAGENVGGDVAEHAVLLGFGVGGEEFREADFSLAGHEDYEVPADGCGAFVCVVGHGVGVDGVLVSVVCCCVDGVLYGCFCCCEGRWCVVGIAVAKEDQLLFLSLSFL